MINCCVIIQGGDDGCLRSLALGSFPVRRSADVTVQVTSSRKAWEACAPCKCFINFETTAYYGLGLLIDVLIAPVGLSVELHRGPGRLSLLAVQLIIALTYI